MNIVERVKKICLSPNSEWAVIEGESTPTSALLGEYAAPLVALGAIAGFIGGSIIGRTIPFVGTFRIGVVTGLIGAVLVFVLAIAGVAIIAAIINALAPTFGAQQNSQQALKLAVYSYTPAWVAGVLQILPFLGILALVAAVYGIYLMYLGLPKLMKCPPEKAAGYTALIVVCGIIVYIVIGAVVGAVTGFGLLASGGLADVMNGGQTTQIGDVQVNKDSPLGRLAEMGKKIEESGKKMEAAEKAGDATGAAAAGIETLGAIFGGGRRVEPISVDELKPFLPETLGGLPRTSSNVERTGIASLMIAKAEATYSAGGKAIDLTISDTGGVSGLVAFASWATLQGEKEDEYGTERTRKIDGRLVHEKAAKKGGENEYVIVLGDRFAVGVTSNEVDLNTLKSLVAGLDLSKLESMKDSGVQK